MPGGDEEMQGKLSPDLTGTEGCRPPCWNEIVPGETSAEKAVEILREMERDDKGEVLDLEINESIQWKNSRGVKFWLDHLENCVYKIHWRIDAERAENNLQGVIEGFGEPDGISIWPPKEDGADLWLELYYPRRGVILYASGGPSGTVTANLSLQAPVFGAAFLAPAEDIRSLHEHYSPGNVTDDLWEFFSANIREWPGFGELELE